MHDQSEARLKEAEEENELLLLQLHQVQEELEQYFLRNQALEKGQTGSAGTVQWVDEELPEALAEVRRLRTLMEAQTRAHQLEAQNALNARLGNILIRSVESSGSLIGVPAKLLKIWRQSTRQQPPGVLGGEGFDKVIAAFGEGGFDAVRQLLATADISPEIQANAYTAVARHLKGDVVQAAEAAREAYSTDPRPYRLKWLAFRLYGAGEILEADALLDLLPQDMSYSDSESREVSQIRYEAKRTRKQEAQKQCRFSERRAEMEQRLKKLDQDREKQVKLAEARAREIEALQTAKAQLEQEKSALAGRQEEQAKLAAERLKQINELQQQINSRQVGEAELAARQQLMHEEMVRAEAQLDLIKDMLLREPGL